MCSASQLAANEHKGLFNDKNEPTFQYIVESKQNANLQTTNNFRQGAISRYNDSRLRRLIVVLDSEGAHLVPKTSCEESHGLVVIYNAQTILMEEHSTLCFLRMDFILTKLLVVKLM